LEGGKEGWRRIRKRSRVNDEKRKKKGTENEVT
jgi:hypothetical protein